MSGGPIIINNYYTKIFRLNNSEEWVVSATDMFSIRKLLFLVFVSVKKLSDKLAFVWIFFSNPYYNLVKSSFHKVKNVCPRINETKCRLLQERLAQRFKTKSITW